MYSLRVSILSNLKNNNYVYVIAEAADAHYGSMKRAMQMIDAAKDAGADFIKFQHHIPDEEMLPKIPTSANMDEPLYEFLKKNALSIRQHVELEKYCKEVGITYLCTPFSLKAAEELMSSVDLPIIKIGSGEMNDFPTIDAIIKFGRPLIISTGMSELHEIDETYDFMLRRTDDFALMNCTSAYPPQISDLNLGFISTMKDRYSKAVIGHSDHFPGIETSIAAIALGARIIEKHVTIDTSLAGPDADVSITFDQLKNLVTIARLLPSGLDDSKYVKQTEIEIRAWARRSLVYKNNFKKGHIIGPDDIWGKRPGTGIPSKEYWNVIGSKLLKDVESNSLVTFEDLSKE